MFPPKEHLDKDKNLQQYVLLGLTLEKVVEGHLTQLLDGEVVSQGHPAREEGEGVAVEGLRIKPDGVGDGQSPSFNFFHVFAQS